MATNNTSTPNIGRGKEEEEDGKDDGGTVPVISSNNNPLQLLLEDTDLALLGNGQDEELNQGQLDQIHRLFQQVEPMRTKICDDAPWRCDLEMCRRYLVARQWNYKKALAQLESTLEWKLNEQDDSDRPIYFWQSPKALENPHALTMRIVGWDQDAGRPIAYTCFAESHDRFHAASTSLHMQLVMEACCQFLQRRRQDGLNRTASSRQWIWVIDFDGFGLYDQNPKMGILTAKVLQHYPELMYGAYLLRAPILFRGVWKLIAPLLDQRVRQKIQFVTGTDEEQQALLTERLGSEAADWIRNETLDSLEQRQKNKNEQQEQKQLKRYWIPPEDPATEHDARGMSSYVQSPYYIKTPGDAYEEQKERQGKDVDDDNA